MQRATGGCSGKGAGLIFLSLGPRGYWSAHGAALLRAADDLFHNSVVSDDTWAALAAKYSTEQMMDLVSWALNSFGVPLDDFLPGAKGQT